MTYTETQLEAIRLFGRKDLTERCLIQIKWEYLFTVIDTDGDIATCYHPLKTIKTQKRAIEDINISAFDGERNKILGHIPHLEDLFRVAEQRPEVISFGVNTKLLLIERRSSDGGTVKIPYNPSLSLLDQPNLSDIISLFR